MAQVTIDRLLSLAADDATTVLTQLLDHPRLADARDAHGYSLVHAASSCGQLELLRALVCTYHVSPDIRDDDDETPLFAAECVDAARCLCEELGATADARNADGQTAEEMIDAEGDFPLVAAYLRGRRAMAQQQSALARPPSLPNGIKVNIGTMLADDVPAEVVDPEFRQKIEELAARDDFQSGEAQAELRRLVEGAVGELRTQDRNVRQRGE